LGDVILGVSLKKYSNDGAKTSNWSVTPSVQLPTGDHGECDTGLSLSYSAETPSFYQLYDLYSWGDRTGLDINAGFAFPGKGSGTFALCDVSVLTSRDGDRIQSGPLLVHFRKNVMFRAEYKALVYERDLLNQELGAGSFCSIPPERSSAAQFRLRSSPSAWAVYWPGRTCPSDPELAAACEQADKWNRRFIWFFGIMWCVGFFAAFVLPRISAS
jgi:hypothetical protein